MKMVVFGGTGRFGSRLVRQALAEGHQVTAVARRPGALAVRHDRLQVLGADVMVPDGLPDLVTGAEAVVFAVGSDHRKTTLVHSDGVINVAAAMRSAGVRRLVCMSSVLVEVPAYGFLYPLWVRFVVDKVRRNPLLDMARMEDELRGTGLDWTVVRMSRLRNSARGPVRSAIDARLPYARPIGVNQAASFVLAHLDDLATHRTTIEIAA